MWTVISSRSFRYCCVQASLNKLMETLGQSEPYFVKCIRSNAEKVGVYFLNAKVWCLILDRKVKTCNRTVTLI